MLHHLKKLTRHSLMALIVCGIASTAQAESVTIGIQSMIAPWKKAIAEKEFEKATGWTIKWRNFDSGGDVMTAMASGDVQIGVAGSSPIAAAVSRGVPIQIFWVLDNIADAEALVVRNGSGIVAPQDLAGKKLAVPFVSTTHFHALFALEQFGIAGKVKVINLQPSDMAAAWERGDIDAAFVWDPALGRLKKSGKVLISSGTLTRWGKATFEALVVDKGFAEKNGAALTAFTKIMQSSTADYVNAPATWTAKAPKVAQVAKLSEAKPEEVPPVLALYEFPLAAEQAGNAWLGGGKEGGVAKALASTAAFLKEQKKIPATLDDYSSAVLPTFVEAAR
jgi:taurine transport system substrate-binding protein